MNTKQKAILRFISGSIFNIDPNWGALELNKILAYQDLDLEINQNDFCTTEKNKTQNIEFYSMKGVLLNSNETVKEKIALININGVMMLQDAMCSYGMNTLDARLRNLYADNSVKGVLLKIHTGGGYSIAGDVMFNAIKDKNKPVVIYTTLLASAGIKGTLFSDEIISASETVKIGSIGTMATIPKWIVGGADKLETIDLYSKDSARKNEVYKALLNGDTSLLINDLTNHDKSFMKAVTKYRNLKGDTKKILSGALFDSVEAKKTGLIDGIGTLNYAFRRINSLIKNK